MKFIIKQLQNESYESSKSLFESSIVLDDEIGDVDVFSILAAIADAVRGFNGIGRAIVG